MGRLVVDTNVLIRIVPARSRHHRLWLSFFDGTNSLCVSTEILEEYEEILGAKTSPNFTSFVMNAIRYNPYTVFVTPYFHFHLIAADPDDDKFVDCAIAGNARCVVSDDRHYDVLKSIGFPKVDVVGLDACMDWLG